ncbi:hypothetical protein [Kiloniella antarctica]|uniref:Methionyl-tRNA formyltransferase-like C-terminal domain-containing protein n=1 Tax=Kiloniella antarctica TaxID=1550907 RepID=A0ABW5BL29_9PROT
MVSEKTYILATIKDWNLDAFFKIQHQLPGKWLVITEQQALRFNEVKKHNPRYIFFPHWSWKIPKEIIDAYDCVCFHMTDLPYGRGGSPLQNLIENGHSKTKISALKMTSEFDAGNIFLKRSLSLHGSAQEIFVRCAHEVVEMIIEIVKSEPIPLPQIGEPTYFKRRTPEQSALIGDMDTEVLYNHIRMLDADTYPHAFIEFGNYRMLFSNANIGDGEVTAHVRFVLLDDK